MYALRICGSNDFISTINEYDERCFPPGSVTLVVGRKNRKTLKFTNMWEAEAASRVVERIEGYTCDVEDC